MKHYDLAVIGTGSAMNLIDPFLRAHPGAKIAVIDKDPPGGICLTRGCIPTKMLVYPAELIRSLEAAAGLGLDIAVTRIDFAAVMKRMHRAVDPEIEAIRKSLAESRDLDYYPQAARFTGPRRLDVGGTSITADMMFLGCGSRPRIPPIQNIENVAYHTSDTILGITRRPESIAIVGGGYIAAEYGHFFAAMGSRVTLIGRNARLLPGEEPEVSALAKLALERHMTVLAGHEVTAVEERKNGLKELTARPAGGGRARRVAAELILLAAGRRSNADILQPEKSGIKTDAAGWIVVDAYLETSAPNIWAFGDALGKFQFKHSANYESRVVYTNAILKEKIKMDYHAVPHAVFTHPEIASVGLSEDEARRRHGDDAVLVGFQRFQDTAKGDAMGVTEGFVKIIAARGSGKILGAHIIGPQASLLIQEIVTLMYTRDASVNPIINGMHIHPALSEVVERACQALMPADEYRRRVTA
jgi:dihydrolipoamide dehydrogenase